MAVITKGEETPKARERAAKLTKAANRPLAEGAWLPRPEEYKVYLYTTAKRELTTTHALLAEVRIPACEAGTRYRKVRFIPHPFPQGVEDVFGVGAEPFHYHDAQRIAQDICDPGNPTLTQGVDYQKIDPYWLSQEGANFSKYGVFWSRNETPTEEEIKAAETRRDTYYRYLIQYADKLFASDPRRASQEITEDHRIALDHFGEERTWHKKFVAMISCPNCAQQIPQGVAYHRDLDGDLCILDWKRTVTAGKRKKEDVPEDLRWWIDQPEKKAK
jgi:hypothetical protein